MCNNSGIDFVSRVLEESDVKGRRVLEIGALNVNGSVRPVICRLGPSEYIGADIMEGEGVDKICRAEDLPKFFAGGTFGLVVATEVLEHVRDWRRVITNMKGLLENDGILIITTRSYGFGYHGYPYDFWRYEEQDMRVIFGDMHITRLESDPLAPGIFLKAIKKMSFIEKDLAGYRLYSIIKDRRVETVTDLDCLFFRFKGLKALPGRLTSLMLPEAIKRWLKRLLRL